MLNRILQKLNGHAAEPPSLAEALEQLGRDKTAVQDEITELNAKRRQALLDDASDAALDKLEREIDRATVRLEKLNIAEAPLREQLASATAAERHSRWQVHLAEHRRIAGEFLSAARATAKAHSELIAVMDGARAAGFERELMSRFPVSPNISGNAICAPNLLDLFERCLSPEPVRRSPPRPAAPPAPQKRPSVGDSVRVVHHGVTASVPLEPSGLPAKNPDHVGPLSDGEVLARVVREGYPDSEGRYSHAGRRIALPRAVADGAARNGAIEILTVGIGL